MQVVTSRAQNEKYLERTVLRKSNTQNVTAAEADPVLVVSAALQVVRHCLVTWLGFSMNLYTGARLSPHFREGWGSSITIPTPLLPWSRRQSISACPLVGSVPGSLCAALQVCASAQEGSHLSAALQGLEPGSL